MTLVLATIPDETADLPAWLEEQLVGGDFQALATELAAIHDAEPPADSVRDYLGDSLLAGVLARGFAALPEYELRSLLRQPYHLLELQEIVLLEGGPYWDAVTLRKDFRARLAVSRERLEVAFFGPLAEPVEPNRRAEKRPRSRSVLFAIAATAALVFVATLAGTRYLAPPPGPSSAWGWAKAAAFPSNLDRRAYLTHLADEADEWFAERPTDAKAAAQRIAEFRTGCTKLLAADHPQLTATDQTWLRERCRTWGRAIDDQLAAVKETGDAAAALAATDATVRQLSKALRDRVNSV